MIVMSRLTPSISAVLMAPPWLVQENQCGTPSQSGPQSSNAREMSGFGLCPGLLVGGHVE